MVAFASILLLDEEHVLEWIAFSFRTQGQVRSHVLQECCMIIVKPLGEEKCIHSSVTHHTSINGHVFKRSGCVYHRAYFLYLHCVLGKY